MGELRTQRRLAAILAADVVGYSRLMNQDEAGTLAALKTVRGELIDPKIVEHKGRVFKTTGDGLLVEFASVVDAVACAVDIQRGMQAHNADLPQDRTIQLRIGLNLGDIIVEGEDMFGDGVNLAVRLENIAPPGGVAVSGTVRDHLGSRLALDFEDMGTQTVKNIDRPVRVSLVRLSRSFPPSNPTHPDKPSIAVLAFVNMSGDPEQEYFADGMAEEIITALSRMRWLFVIARNSSFHYKGRSVDVKQIGRELGVRYVLEGSVRKFADRVRITGQLIDASAGTHLWAERFDGPLADLFDLQDQVTAKVVGAIAPKLEEAEIERIKRKPTENLDAYDCFLRGMSGIHKWSHEGGEEALHYFYRAIELDPNYAAAHGLAARAYVQRNAGGWSKDRAHDLAEAERLARRAVDLGHDDAVALCTAGFALADFVGAVEDGNAFIEKAIALNPNLAWAWLYSGWVKAASGKADLAIERIARAKQLSPHDPQEFSIQTAMAFAHFIAGRYEEASKCAESAIRERPNNLLPISIATVSAAYLGLSERARFLVTRMREFNPGLSIRNVDKLQQINRPEDLARWREGFRKAGLPE
jgi:TolB-like protein/class 3 adenylate cyclase